MKIAFKADTNLNIVELIKQIGVSCLVLAMLAIVLSAPLLAKESINKAQEIEAELSHTIINDIVQDKNGYIWVATEAGLNRFDGYQVIQMYQQNSGLSYDEINVLEIDTKGNVWIGTDYGLNVYWQETGLIQNFYSNPADPLTLVSDEILSLEAGANGDMWVGTSNGVSYFQSITQSFKTFSITNAVDIPIVNQEITALLVVGENVLLGTSSGQIARLNKEDYFKQLDGEHFLSKISQFVHILNSEIYVVGESNLYILDLETSELSLVNKEEYGLTDSFLKVESIELADDKSLWIATSHHGIYKVDLINNTNEHYFYKHTKDGDVGLSKVNRIFEDRTGLIWIGSDTNLYQLSVKDIQFDHYNQDSRSKFELSENSIFSILVDSDNWHWFGTEFGGVNVFKPSHFGFELDSSIQLPLLNSTSINAIVEGSSNKVWILAADKIWQFDKNTNQFISISDPELDKSTLYSAKYHQGQLWVSSEFGLWRVDNSGKIKQYLISQQIYNLQNKILGFEIDKTTNQIWLATEMGVIRFDINSETFSNLSELIAEVPVGLTGIIYDVHLDIHGRLWVGTYQKGLYKVDFVTQKVEVLNHNNSKINNVIYSIKEDSQHSLWLATAHGLFRLDPSNNNVTHFGVEQGQRIRDFNLGAKAFDHGSNILLAGVNGVIHFDPSAYQEDKNEAIPVITNILIDGKTARIGKEKRDHANTAVSMLKDLTLYHDDISLSITFSGMHFVNSKVNRFRYRLVGFEESWIEVGSDGRRAIYPKLESGDYQFQLLASNKDGLWSQEPKIINLKVLPSPFLSKWALLLYGIVISSIIISLGSLYRFRLNERRAANQRLAESEERLKLSLWGSGDELWDWDIKSGALHLSNEWDCDFPRDGIRSGHSDANSNIHPYDLPFVKQALQAHLSGKSEHFESTYRISNDDGGWIWVLDQGKSVEFDGERASRMAGTLKNVTEIKDAEQRLSVIAKSFENISDAVWILDDSLRYIAINKAFEVITGYSEEEVIGAPMQENAIKDMSESFYKRLMELLNEKGSWQGELEAIKSDGSIYPIDINIDVVRNNEGQVINYVGVFSDITYRKIAEKELRRLATTDQLTHLPNRNTFRSEVELILNSSDAGKEHALLFIDLDNFKRINDSLGHSVGDELLIAVAEKLRGVMLDNKGMVARLGGDEFIIFMEDVASWSQPAQVAQSVLDAFEQKLELTNNEIQVSPSIGVVMSPENGTTADDLLRNADTAMYYAKKKGKNTFQFYTQQMNEQAQMRLNLENDLRKAIERDEFVVFYQPKVCLETGVIKGFESLVRWRSEERGLVMPNEFIPLAEETGLIVPISQQVIEKSCIQIRDWQKRGLFDGKMAINLSAVQFYHENLWETVKNAMHLANLEPSSLEFEITEGMVMQDLAHSIQQMNTLKDMGVALALDDFGVGYSSLGNLKDFPIDTLKIDRSFIWDLDDSERDKKLVASIITLAHNLDIKVVAEGVETIKQVEALKEMNCEQIQGFIYSRPLPAFEIEKLLQDPEATLDRALKEAEAEGNDR